MLKHLKSTSQMELLAEVSQLLTQFDMNRVLGRVIRLVANAVGANRAHLALHPHYELDWRQIFQTDRLDPDTVYTVSVGGLDDGLAGWVGQQRKGTVVEDTRTDERRDLFARDLRDAGSALAVPLICNQDLMAVLTLLHPEAGHFGAEHLRLVTIAMNQAAVAVHNARLENHVRSGQHQFESVLHAVESIMLVLDAQGHVLVMNAAAARYLGVIPDECLRLPLESLTQGDTAFAEILATIAQPLEQEYTWSFRAHSDQHGRDFDVLLAVWENPLQGQSGYVVIMHDVTTLLELDRFKNDMLRMASHDLRSPLALVTGYCDLIEMDAESPQNVRAYVNSIRLMTDRMDMLLKDLLSVDRINSSPRDLQQPVSPAALLAQVIEHSLPDANRKQQQLVTDFLDLPETIVADAVLLREAMENLVSNAIKYTPERGQIIVRAYSQGTSFYFVVEDNGIGIPEEHLSRLFTTFYRAKQPGTEHIDGTGIGLSLVKTVVERHQGKVWVESQVGVGSQFGFWIPLS